jgi:signal transduction histidine kinase
MSVKRVGIFIICWVLAYSSNYAQSKLDSLITIITSNQTSDSSTPTKTLVSILKQDKNEQLERLASKIIDKLNLTTSTAGIEALIEIGSQVYEDRGLPVWAIQFYKEANEQSEKLHNSAMNAAALKRLSMIYFQQNLMADALRYSYESCRVFESIKDYANTAFMFYYAASINYRSGNPANCISDFDSCLKNYEKVSSDSVTNDLRFSVMSGWNTMGLAHRKMENYGKSLEAFQKALQMAKDSQNQFWVALVNGNKGTTLFQMGRGKEAIPYAKEDMRISTSFNQYTSAGFACIFLAEIYVSINDASKSKTLLDSMPYFIHHAQSDKPLLRNSYAKVQAKYYALTKQFEKAHDALLLQMRLSDSIRNEERSSQLVQIQAGFNLEKKENEIQLLAKNNELQQKEINTQRFLIFGSVLFALFVIGFLFYFFVSYRKEKRQKEIIELQQEDIEEKNAELEAQSNTLLQQNEVIRGSNQLLETKVVERTSQLQDTIKELDTFLYHASHDIRRPIATLLGLENVARAEKNQSQFLDYVADTARDMDSMLSKLQMAYRINQPIDDVHEIDLKLFIQTTLKKFNDQIDQLKIDINLEIDDKLSLITSPSLFTVVFQNLIENSIHFRSPEMSLQIKVSAKENKDQQKILNEDNGIGIQEKQLDKIFDLYYRGTDRSKGNGMGLYLTKKSLQKIHGEISVESVFGKGTVFTISVPRNIQNT